MTEKHEETGEEIEKIEENTAETPAKAEAPPESKTTEKKISSDWIPKTKLGNHVLKGEVKSIEEIINSGFIILESGIVDMLIPDLKQ